MALTDPRTLPRLSAVLVAIALAASAAAPRAEATKDPIVTGFTNEDDLRDLFGQLSDQPEAIAILDMSPETTADFLNVTRTGEATLASFLDVESAEPNEITSETLLR